MCQMLSRMATENDVYILYIGQAEDSAKLWFENIGIKAAYEIEDATNSLRLKWPRSYYGYNIKEIRRKVSFLDAQYKFDIINTEYSQMARSIGREVSSRTILVEHDITYLTLFRQSRRAKTIKSRLKVLLAACFFYISERYWWKRYSITVCMSRYDASIVSRTVPENRIRVIPNGAVLALRREQLSYDGSRLSKILFVGDLEHFPNEDAIIVFIEDMYRQVRSMIPDVELIIVGRSTAKVRAFHNPKGGILVKGFVDDLTEIYNTAAVAIAPIRIGSGTRLKILEAMAHGVPVVSTSIGAEGLRLKNDYHLLIADDAEAFIRGIAKLLEDRPYADQIARNAWNLVEKDYSWDSIYSKYRELFSRIIAD